MVPNLLVIGDTDLAGKCALNWQEHLAHSALYERMMMTECRTCQEMGNQVTQAKGARL